MVELKTIETVDTSPFKHLVMTVGELPTSFVDSMTYYECLAWLVNYLQNTVIPAVNNNAEATEELQAAFITLKNYVDNYFDNLDVQEEIDNKLDEMAESGVLQEIIDTYFQEITDLVNAQNAVIANFEADTNEDIADFKTTVNNRMGSQDTDIQQLISRMDTFSSLEEGSTTGDAELADGRIAFTGRTFTSIGNNIRAYQGVMFTNIMSDASITHNDGYYYPASMQKTELENYESWTFPTKKGHLYIVDTNTSGRIKNLVLGYTFSVPDNSVTSGTHYDPIVFIGNGATIMVNNSTSYATPFIGELKSINDYDELTNLYTDITNDVTIVSNKYIDKDGVEHGLNGTDYASFTPKAGHYYKVVTAFGGQFNIPLSYQEDGNVYPDNSGTYSEKCQGLYTIYAVNNNTLYINKFGSRVFTDSFKIYESNQTYATGETVAPIESCIGAFNKVVFIGDSLTNGSTFTSSNASYLNYYDYKHALTKLWGIEDVKKIASGGYSSSDWWDRYKDDIIDEDCLYLVWLGTNGGLTDTVATDCAGSDYTQFADTNTGNYGKIVGKIKTMNNAKVVLLNVFKTNSTTTNKAISDIATKYSCPVINLDKPELRAEGYHTAYNGYYNATHLNSQGYNLVANIVNQQLSNYMKQNAGTMEIYKAQA